MIEQNPTLKEYLTNYQFNHNSKIGLNASNITFMSNHQRSKLIQHKLEKIKIILKQNLDEALYSEISKDIEEAKILAMASMDESRVTTETNHKASENIKNQRSSRNHLRCQKGHKKAKSTHPQVEIPSLSSLNPEKRQTIPLQSLRVPENIENLKPESPLSSHRSILKGNVESYCYESINSERNEFLAEVGNKMKKELSIVPPKLSKSEYDDLIDANSMRQSLNKSDAAKKIKK